MNKEEFIEKYLKTFELDLELGMRKRCFKIALEMILEDYDLRKLIEDHQKGLKDE